MQPPITQFKNPDLPLVVVVAHTRWDEPPRMRHDVTQQLMRWFNVLFVELFPAYRTDGKLNTVDDRLIVYSPQTWFLPNVRLYANEPLTHHLLNLSYVKLILKNIKKFASNTCILFNFAYDFPEIMNEPVFIYKGYICNDEFPKMHSRSRIPLKRYYQLHLFQNYENQVARSATQCFTCHRPLHDKLSLAGGKVEYLFHANPYKEIINAKQKSNRDKIHVGFAGYINYRILSDWFLEVLKQDDMILHLIGTPEKGYERQFENYNNVRLHTHLSHSKFKEKIGQMDVLTMPYNPNIPEVRIMTTNSKTFQCIAAGRPLVISDMPNYYEFPDGVIYIAHSATDFVKKIREAHAEDCDKFRKLRAKISSDNTWDKRGEQLYSNLKKTLGSSIFNL